jgi:hypothetical protein
VLAADPLDVSASDATRWEVAPEEERLFWRLVYLLETERDDSARFRELAGRIVTSLARTGSADVTHELLPVLLDQPRFCAILARHRQGIISRTGFLSVIAECGYPEHMKLWLRHASPHALGRLCERLLAGRYDEVAASFGERPA